MAVQRRSWGVIYHAGKNGKKTVEMIIKFLGVGINWRTLSSQYVERRYKFIIQPRVGWNGIAPREEKKFNNCVGAWWYTFFANLFCGNQKCGNLIPKKLNSDFCPFISYFSPNLPNLLLCQMELCWRNHFIHPFLKREIRRSSIRLFHYYSKLSFLNAIPITVAYPILASPVPPFPPLLLRTCKINGPVTDDLEKGFLRANRNGDVVLRSNPWLPQKLPQSWPDNVYLFN